MVGRDEQELQELAERLARLVARGMGSRSLWALKLALETAEVDGVSGVLTVRLPRRDKESLDMDFTTGARDA